MRQDTDAKKNEKKNLTILLPGGSLPLPILQTVAELAERFGFGVYLTTVQNLRLVDVPAEALAEVEAAVVAAGADIKRAGLFPKLKVCAGQPHCNLATADGQKLARVIHERYGSRTGIKPKVKIAFAACPASCSNATLADIGIVATRKGYDLYVGGKGGGRPQVGRRVLRGADFDTIVEAVGRLVEYHQEKTGKKQRMFKLVDNDDFPYPAA